MTRRLYTFTISHFSEKARWALDYKGVPYEERRLVPGSHIPIIKRIAPGSSVPVLLDGERITQGSGAIIDYAEKRWPERSLTPATVPDQERALELERWLDRELGETLRRVFYFHALDHRDLALSLFNQGGPFWGRLLSRIGFRVIAQRIREMYAITAENVALDERRLSAVFERLDALLENRRYLVGDRFSRADLTLAALMAPLWKPKEHSTHWPPEALYPPETGLLRAQFAGSRAREHTLRLYRENRQSELGMAAAAEERSSSLERSARMES